MLERRNFSEYLRFCFKNETNDIEEVSEIPSFPDMTGDHKTINKNYNNILVEETTSSNFKNIVRYRIPIDPIEEIQKTAIWEFSRVLLLNNKKEISKIKFYKDIKDDPTKCSVYILIEYKD